MFTTSKEYYGYKINGYKTTNPRNISIWTFDCQIPQRKKKSPKSILKIRLFKPSKNVPHKKFCLHKRHYMFPFSEYLKCLTFFGELKVTTNLQVRTSF